jgi:hypothetical protein
MPANETVIEYILMGTSSCTELSGSNSWIIRIRFIVLIDGKPNLLYCQERTEAVFENTLLRNILFLYER